MSERSNARLSLTKCAEGLARLPQIELRPEGEPYKPPSQHPSRSPSPAVAGDVLTSPDLMPDAQQNPSSLMIPPKKEHETPSPVSISQSTSPSRSEPLGAITNLSEEPSQKSDSLPAPVVEIDTGESSMLQEAMSDSVLGLTAPVLSRDPPAELVKPAKQSTSGADLILPIIIFAVVKSNPPQLASQLMFLRRYRSAICLTGEASYAIVNLTAVVEFLEHVELAELGLGHNSDKVIR